MLTFFKAAGKSSKKSHYFHIQVLVAMKRFSNEIDAMTMANYLTLLSKVGESDTSSSSSSVRMFECKTCNRQFPSFQALGGHRASHKKLKLGEIVLEESRSPKKVKTTHERSICGIEFAIGQAPGGHMRRHKAETAANSGGELVVTRSLLTLVMMKSNSSVKRV